MFDEKVLEEIEEVLDINRIISETILVPILFDGNQHTMKIPKHVVEKTGIGKHSIFKFKIVSQFTGSKRDVKLMGHLVDKKDEKSKECK